MGDVIRLVLPDHDAVLVDLDDAPCPNFPCPFAETCVICFTTLCSRHQPESVTPCCEGGWHHIEDCDLECEPCMVGDW